LRRVLDVCPVRPDKMEGDLLVVFLGLDFSIPPTPLGIFYADALANNRNNMTKFSEKIESAMDHALVNPTMLISLCVTIPKAN